MFRLQPESLAKSKAINDAIKEIFTGSHDETAKKQLSNALVLFIGSSDDPNHLLNAVIMGFQLHELGGDDPYAAKFFRYRDNPVEFGVLLLNVHDGVRIRTVDDFNQAFKEIRQASDMRRCTPSQDGAEVTARPASSARR